MLLRPCQLRSCRASRSIARAGAKDAFGDRGLRSGEVEPLGRLAKEIEHVMARTQNHQVRLAARPVGLPKRSDWQFTEAPVPEPRDGEVLAKVLYLSLDPAMRGWMNEGKSYIAPIGIGEAMRAGGVGRVTASKHPGFAVDDYVGGALGAQEYAALPGAQLAKIDAKIAPLPVFLNALGMPGMTAYFGLLDVGEPKPGDAVVVSGAAGAVGATVGQIAKIKGCRAIGIAGGAAKCRYLVDGLGFDAAIDYKAEDVRKSLRALSGRRQRLLRQCWRRYPRRRACPAGAARPRRAVRRNLPVQQHDADQGPQQLPVAPRQPGADGGYDRVRLREPLSRGGARHRRLDGGGQAEVA